MAFMAHRCPYCRTLLIIARAVCVHGILGREARIRAGSGNYTAVGMAVRPRSPRLDSRTGEIQCRMIGPVCAEQARSERNSLIAEYAFEKLLNRFEIPLGQGDNRWARAAQAHAEEIGMLQRERAFETGDKMLAKGLVNTILEGFA